MLGGLSPSPLLPKSSDSVCVVPAIITTVGRRRRKRRTFGGKIDSGGEGEQPANHFAITNSDFYPKCRWGRGEWEVEEGGGGIE